MAGAKKQLESMVSRTDKTRQSSPPLIKQIWEFLEDQLEISEKREKTVGTFVMSANEVTIASFWRE